MLWSYHTHAWQYGFRMPAALYAPYSVVRSACAPRLERRRCVLNAAPRAASLFVRAIVMSGACIVDADAGWGPGNHSYGLHAGAAFAHGASLQARKLS